MFLVELNPADLHYKEHLTALAVGVNILCPDTCFFFVTLNMLNIPIVKINNHNAAPLFRHGTLKAIVS